MLEDEIKKNLSKKILQGQKNTIKKRIIFDRKKLKKEETANKIYLKNHIK